MNKTLSIRELTRSSRILLDYDYIDIEDRKSHEYKGVFVPKQYADEVKDYIDKKLAEENRKRKRELMQYAGIAHGDIGERNIQDIKGEKADR